jgi:2-iminobutanoate/2-iminopropanoate deaminase
MHNVIRSNEAPAAVGPYSQAVEADGWVFCSGQIPLDPATGQIVGGDIRAATRRALLNLQAVLAAAGCSWGDVVKVTVFLVDMGDFPNVNEVYGEVLGEARPARACVEVSRLPKGASIEVEAVARRSRG